jgi:hypothetical protein
MGIHQQINCTELWLGCCTGSASRALRGYNDELADECLATAKKVWDEEHGHAPDLFHHGNTTGGQLEDEELKAAVELLICTKDARYAKAIEALWQHIENSSVALLHLLCAQCPIWRQHTQKN